MKRTIYLIFALAFISFAAGATSAERDTLGVNVYFRQGEGRIDPGYRGNRDRLDAFFASLSNILKNEKEYFQFVSIATGASPEGSTSTNEKLSMQRARSIRDYVLSHSALSAAQVRVYSRGVDWDGLADALKMSNCPWRDEALSIIYADYGDVSSEIRNEKCKQQLKAVSNGELWRWIDTYLFEDLRSARGSLSCVMLSPVLSSRDTLVISSRDTLYISSRDTLVTLQRRTNHRYDADGNRIYFRRDSSFRIPVMAFRTNLLLPLLNVGIEVPTGNRVSLAANFYYPWARRQWINNFYPTNRYCAQGLLADAQVRFWLGSSHSRTADRKYRLRGHSIGLLANCGLYDVEYDCSGQQGEFVALGVDYRYSQPLGRGGVHLDFSIGVGYCLSQYRMYGVPQSDNDEFHLIGEGPRQYWQGPVPMNVGISLVVPVFSRRNVR